MYFKSVVACLFVVLLAGCGGSKISYEFTVKIERSIAAARDPYLVIIAEKATLDYNQRLIYMTGVKNIAGDNCHDSGWVVNQIEIDDQRGIKVVIPPDAPYNITIGKQYHWLPAIVDSK